MQEFNDLLTYGDLTKGKKYFQVALMVKNSANAEDTSSIPGSGRFLEEGNGTPLPLRATTPWGCKELGMTQHVCTQTQWQLLPLHSTLELNTFSVDHCPLCPRSLS